MSFRGREFRLDLIKGGDGDQGNNAGWSSSWLGAHAGGCQGASMSISNSFTPAEDLLLFSPRLGSERDESAAKTGAEERIQRQMFGRPRRKHRIGLLTSQLSTKVRYSLGLSVQAVRTTPVLLCMVGTQDYYQDYSPGSAHLPRYRYLYLV